MGSSSTELHEQILINEFGYPTHVPFLVLGADTAAVVLMRTLGR
jgi:hypothetical protein